MDLDLDQMAFQDTAQVMGSNPVGASEMFLGFPCNWFKLLHNCDDHFHPQFTHMIFIIYTSRHSLHTAGIN